MTSTRFAAGWGLGLTGLALAAGCSTCPREGCDALSRPAAGSGQSAIAGAVALESDVVGNGCQECPLSSTRLDLWKTSSLVADAATARAVVAASAPSVSVQADGHYRQPVDAGTYLVCAKPECASVEVIAGRTTTVNVKLLNGPTQFVVFDPGSTAARAAASLEVGL